MPLPTPDSDETKPQFIGRCKNDEKMRQEYPDDEQRVAVCNSQWKKIKKSDDTTGDDNMSIFDKFFGGNDGDGDKDLLEKGHGLSLDALNSMSADELIASFAQLSVQVERVVSMARSMKDEMEDRDIDVPGNTMSRVLDSPGVISAISKADQEGDDDKKEADSPIDEEVEKGTSLASMLRDRMSEVSDSEDDMESVVSDMASAAGISQDEVNSIIRAEVHCPPLDTLRGFAEALDVDIDDVALAANRDGCEYELNKNDEDNIDELIEKAMPGKGATDAEVMFVGGSPSKLDMIRDSVFTGPVGATLQEKYASEIDANGMFITNAVPEYLSDDDGNPREPTEEDIEKWMPLLKKQIEQVWPEHIVALGKSAKSAVEQATGISFDESDNEWVPHPRALNIHGDSGEVGRKLSRLNKTLNDRDKDVSVQKAVIDDDIPPIGPEIVFNKLDAMRRVRSWAGGPRKSNINFTQFARAFLVRDGDPTNISSYKLMIADVVDGELRTIPAALRTAMESLDDVEGLSDSERRQLRSSVRRTLSDDDILGKSINVSIEKQEEEKRLALGVVMEPEVEDADGNWATEEEIEDACHYFMKNHQEVGHEHIYKIEDGVHVVESYVLRDDANIGGRNVRKGSWIMGVKCENDEVWDRVKKGEYKGFSIDGRAIISPEERL